MVLQSSTKSTIFAERLQGDSLKTISARHNIPYQSLRQKLSVGGIWAEEYASHSDDITNEVLGILISNARIAANKVVALLDSTDDKVALKAAAFILDRTIGQSVGSNTINCSRYDLAAILKTIDASKE